VRLSGKLSALGGQPWAMWSRRSLRPVGALLANRLEVQASALILAASVMRHCCCELVLRGTLAAVLRLGPAKRKAQIYAAGSAPALPNAYDVSSAGAAHGHRGSF